MRFQSKPQEVEAMQFTNNNWDMIVAFTNGKAVNYSPRSEKNKKANCWFLGRHIEEGDWFLYHGNNEFSLMSETNMSLYYEPMEDQELT